MSFWRYISSLGECLHKEFYSGSFFALVPVFVQINKPHTSKCLRTWEHLQLSEAEQLSCYYTEEGALGFPKWHLK